MARVREKSNPSSMRGRVDRSRKYHSGGGSNGMIIVLGVLVVGGIAAFVFSLNSAPKPPKDYTPPKAKKKKAIKSSELGFGPKVDKLKSVYNIVFYAGHSAKKGEDPQDGLKLIEQGIAKFGEKPDFYDAKANLYDYIAFTSSDKSKKLEYLEKKLNMLQKAQALIDSGKSYSYDPTSQKVGNLVMKIEQAQKALNKLRQ